MTKKQQTNQFHVSRARIIIALGMVFADALSITISMSLAWLLRIWILGPLNYKEILYCILLFIFLYCLINTFQGLYEPVGMPTEEQVKRIVIDTFFLGFAVTTIFFVAKVGSEKSRAFFCGIWIIQVFVGPLLRFLVQRIMQKVGLWGLPVGVLSDNIKQIEAANDYIQKHPETGVKFAFACAYDEEDGSSEKIVLLREEAFKQMLKKQGFTTLMIFGKSIKMLIDKRKEYRPYVSNVIATDKPGSYSDLYGIQFCQHGNYYGLSMSQPLLRRRGQIIKRMIDFFLCFIGLIFISPLFLSFMLIVKLDSPGPVFYVQKRRGKAGKTFGMYKFRSMCDGADLKLQEYLNSNLEAKAEWNTYQKLSNDPRITRMGRFLRKTSMDELPQIINILKGEMSLVGPRPFISGEQEILYGETIQYYDQVLPGITGLWQVKSRNDGTYEERAKFDYQYIMTWSIWKDICILFATVPAVLKGKTS
ncbi:MAG: exopolysaccharide biosynthesis polyprenyl glycosylphosphotransferase [Flexilinea sp.]